MTRKIYFDANGVQLHARVAGDGAPVVLLHASPLSAAFLQGHIDVVKQKYLAIAVDTPGYGGSDPLPAPAHSLDDYADHILAGLSSAGHDRFYLYGTATGAQIALAMAKRAPARIEKLVLDNCGHFEETLRRAWRDEYFPDLSPQADGSHWMKAWQIASAQFRYFPWHIQTPETALNRPAPPAEMITQMALGFMSARPQYDAAYRLAFEAEDIASFDGLTVPTTLIDWEASIVRPYLLALIDKGLPPVVAVARCGLTMQDRLEALMQALAK
jgi:pimeloyl-ACP methyl ester carboxylesterase